jgi:hypothetical protein
MPLKERYVDFFHKAISVSIVLVSGTNGILRGNLENFGIGTIKKSVQQVSSRKMWWRKERKLYIV